MNQRLERVEGCHPLLRRSVLELCALCEQKLKKKLCLVSGFRSIQEQMLIYQKGRTFDPGNAVWVVTEPRLIVTRSLPGLSAHNVITTAGKPASMAVDVVPFDAAGGLDWDIDMDFWDDLYEVAWKVGLDPLGDQVGSYLKGDLGHFEEPAWKLKIDGLGCYQPVSETPAQV